MFDFYKVGGSLRYGHPTYIQRKADRDIYNALKQKEFCYVLNSRQMGKSSLRVRTMKTLIKEGFKCVAIDLGILGSSGTAEQWYGGLASELWHKLRLSKGIDDDLKWWRSHCELSPIQRLSRFIEDVLLVNCSADIIIFLDEVDNIIKLDFPDEFLTLIRNCYERRVESKEYRRLTFCLLGVATPSSLKIDKQISPFNIGKAIHLTGFSFAEAQPLLSGLNNKISRSEEILQHILSWTKGQPFLTQKLCSLVVKHAESGAVDLPQLIQNRIINSWEMQDEPEHLKTIRDRLLYDGQNKARMLTIYQKIVTQKGININGSEEQVELLLSGLVCRQGNKLEVSNPIYLKVFDLAWVTQQLFAISPYQDAVAAWLKSDRQDKSRLLRGQALLEAQNWAKKHSVSAIEIDFLQQSESMAIREKMQADLAQKAEYISKELAQKKRLLRWQRLFIFFSLAMITGFYLKSRQANLSYINTLIRSSQALSASNQKLDALIAAIKAKQQLNKSLRVNQNLTQQVDDTLQQIVYGIKEKDRLLGHEDRLYAVAVFSDGKLMATAATDNTVRLWQKKITGWQLYKVLKHRGWVVDVAISADGNIVSASRDRTVKIWNKDGKLLNTLKHLHPVTSVAIQNNRVITGDETGDINIWQQGKLIQILKGHTATVNALAVTPDNRIVSASEDKTLKIWQQGKTIETLKGHTEGVRAVAIFSDGNKIVSASRDRTLKIWNEEGNAIATLKGHLAPVYGVAIDPFDNRIVSASADRTLKIWHSNGTEIATLQGHTNRVWDVTYLPNGNIASVGWDKTIRLWQPDNNLINVLTDPRDVVISLDYSQNLIASTSDDKTVKLWNSQGTLLKTFRQHTAEVYDVALGDNFIASVGADRTLKIWQANNNIVKTIQAHNSPIWSVEISPDNQKIVTAGNDRVIKIWDSNGNLLHTLNSHSKKIWDLAVTSNNQHIVSASEDNTVKVWDLNGNLLRTLNGHSDAVRSVVTDRKQIISAGEDRTIKIWNWQGKLIGTLEKHQTAIKAIALSPDEQYLASVDDDGKIILWQQSESSWQYIKTIQGHDNSIWSVIFSPDSKTLATAGEDTKVILWNIQNILRLDSLKYGCNWATNYLYHSSEADSQIKRNCKF